MVLLPLPATHPEIATFITGLRKALLNVSTDLLADQALAILAAD
jgi:hypothetical protein